MMTTYPVGTKLDLKLQVDRYEVNTVAIVRVSYPFLGMGIEFTELAIEDHHRLEGLIEWLAGTWSEAAPATSPVPCPSSDPEPATTTVAEGRRPLLESLRHFFESHAALTREEFAELLRDCREP